MFPSVAAGACVCRCWRPVDKCNVKQFVQNRSLIDDEATPRCGPGPGCEPRICNNTGDTVRPSVLWRRREGLEIEISIAILLPFPNKV